MQMVYEPRPRPRPTQQVLAEQQRDAERVRQQRAAQSSGVTHVPPATAAAPAKPATAVVPVARPALPAVPDNRSPLDRYLDDIAPTSIVGRLVGFDGKDKQFIYRDDGTPITDDVDFIVMDDQVQVSWVKFQGKGEPPVRVGGLLSEGFVLPERDTLGDDDASAWETGLDGKPQDPWVHQISVVMQRGDNGELVTFVTGTATGRRAIGNLLKHARRMNKTHPDMYALVRFKLGGFNHRDERVGWVVVPVFAVVGRHPKDDAAKPDSSPQADMDDSIPFS
jgi:hypothetical protein